MLMKLEFFRQFEKSSGIRFNENAFSGCSVISCGWTDRQTEGHDEIAGRFSQFHKSA